jgi:polar amino acid transport system permease protein
LELRFFEIYRHGDYLLILAEGLWVSFILTVLGAIIGFALAVGLSAARDARNPILRSVSAAYVELLRNTPLIVQMFFIAFGLPLLLNYHWPFWGHAFGAMLCWLWR